MFFIVGLEFLYAPDIAAAPFLAPLTVPELLANAFRMDIRDLDQAFSRNDANGDALRAKVEKLPEETFGQ